MDAPHRDREHNRKYDIIFFDFDGTLAVTDDNLSAWSHLHERYAVPSSHIEEMHRKYKAGSVTYDQWFEDDVGLWRERGAKKHEIVDEFRKHLRLHLHAAAVLHRLKKEGYHLVLVSGGLRLALDAIFPEHPFDEVFIGNIEFDHDAKIVNCVHSPYSDESGKLVAVNMVLEREQIPLSRAVFVGDGFNDVDAMKAVGFSIAFNSNDESVRGIASSVVDSKDYRDVLPLLLKQV